MTKVLLKCNRKTKQPFILQEINPPPKTKNYKEGHKFQYTQYLGLLVTIQFLYANLN